MFPAGESTLMATLAAFCTYYGMGWFAEPMTEILPGQVWLGNLAGAWAPGTLDDAGITHVVAATQFGQAAAFYPDRYLYHVIAVQDSPDQDIGRSFEAAGAFIQQALQEGGRVFVHCNQGRSRSVSVLAAYLMKYRRMHMVAALELIRARRTVACPNPGFVRQLTAYEHQLRPVKP